MKAPRSWKRSRRFLKPETYGVSQRLNLDAEAFKKGGRTEEQPDPDAVAENHAAFQIFPVDSRGTGLLLMYVILGSLDGCVILLISALTSSLPKAVLSTLMVEREGVVYRFAGEFSNPITLTRSGTGISSILSASSVMEAM